MDLRLGYFLMLWAGCHFKTDEDYSLICGIISELFSQPIESFFDPGAWIKRIVPSKAEHICKCQECYLI